MNTDFLDIHNIDEEQQVSLQFYESRIQAGFPSPAQGSYGDAIDLNRELIDNPAATFCARVTGSSMTNAGIDDGDLIIIDRSLDPHHGNIAVCFIDGEFTVKRITIKDDGIYLTPANSKFPEFHVTAENNFVVWGIVTRVIKHLT